MDGMKSSNVPLYIYKQEADFQSGNAALLYTHKITHAPD